MRVLLLSAYAAGSHVHWQRSLQSMFPSWEWQILSLPPRHFSWRVRGNPLYWALEEPEKLAVDYDLLIATSMVDLATLRGLVPALAAIPAIVYFHENQFEYPQGNRQHSLLEAQMVSIYSALAADRIVFNSRYNMRTFLQGCSNLMSRLPDHVPHDLPGVLQEKSSVLAVPSDKPPVADAAAVWPWTPGSWPQRSVRLCWLGRFEHDKGGDGLLRILYRLEQAELDYELSVTGQQFRRSPEVFEQIESGFRHRLVQFGYVESREAYGSLLSGADIVLSTSLHEFQGLAVQEAVACGCLPVVPERLVYPEIYPAQFIYSSDLEDSNVEACAATELILQLASGLQNAEVRVPDVTAFSLSALAPKYARLFSEAMAGRHSQ
jgi:glycosyltransferase involved in cell wall biosynthesis